MTDANGRKGVKASTEAFFMRHGKAPKNRIPVKASGKLPLPTEAQEQCVLANYLDRLGVLWCHVANERHTSKISGARLKAQGVKSGVPDVFVYTRSPKTQRPVAIELKRQKGGRVTPAQKRWLRDLKTEGFETYLALGAQDAITYLTELGFTRANLNKEKSEL